ncbi:MAG: DUF1553 domain-containing protein [Planctomycetota bacterium]
MLPIRPYPSVVALGLAAALATANAGTNANTGTSRPTADELSADDLEFFESRVRPVLVRECISCHTDRPGKGPAGGLRLDLRDGWRVGGDSGPAIVPGDPDASLLVQAVRRASEDLAMPPDVPIGARELADLEEWVRRGAPDPRDSAPRSLAVDMEAARSHWAFRPVIDPVVPAGEDGAIDAFVSERLAELGLELAPEADRRTLARRLHLDLVGVPPTPERVAEFERDTRPDAYERLVDELLDSPAYAERYGRHWLDVARYADSNGLDENVAMAEAWRYRDWVVRAFERDLPYDRFVTAQLAGDLVEGADGDDLVATGFLVLGAKMLAEQDQEKMALDIVDEQLDVAGRAFMGMTLGCARCHDHKFDPVPTRDYYALAGIFRSTRTMESLATVARWNEREIGTAGEIAARHAWVAERDAIAEELATARESALLEQSAAWRADVGSLLRAGLEARRSGVFVEAETFADGNVGRDDSNFGTPEVTVVREVMAGMPQFAEWDVEVRESGTFEFEFRHASGESRPLALSIDGAAVDGSWCTKATGTYQPDTQTWEDGPRVELAAGAHRVRLERRGSWPHLDKFVLWPVDDEGRVAPSHERWPRRLLRNVADALGRPSQRAWLGPWIELAESCGDEPFDANALSRAVRDEDDVLEPVRELFDGAPPRDLRELEGRYAVLLAALQREAGRSEDGAEPSDAFARLDELVFGPSGVLFFSDAEGGAPLEEALAADVRALEARRERNAAAEPPMLPRALAVKDAEPVDLPVHLRGDHLNLGPEPVPRGFLSVIDPLVTGHAIGGGNSGRLELAQWLTDARNPLTARVMANRVWQWHMGRGLVGTSSNFGLRGDAPSHPELLDWLASRFVEDGWSVKSLHRRILLSRTYRQSAVGDPRGAEVDPEDVALWHFPTRRLEAEVVRDSILAVAGELDEARGGSLLDTANHDYVTNDQSQSKERYDSKRRSLYLPVVRNAQYEFFATFDYPDPSLSIARRPVTSVASQALWLLHSPLATQAAAALAQRAASEAEDADPLERAFALALAREPSENERAACERFLASGGDLAGFCQVLLSTSEFLHLP